MMKHSRFALQPVAFVLAMGIASVGMPTKAHAQKANITQKERRDAKRLFNKAHLAYRRGDYEEAILKWEQSFELSGEPLIYLSIANAYERLGDAAQALDYLQRWRKSAPRREREELDSRIEALEARVGEEKHTEDERKREEDARLAEEKERLRQERLAELKKKENEGGGGLDIWTIAGWSMVGTGAAAVIAGVTLDGVAASKRPSKEEACLESDSGLLCRDALRDDIESSNTLALAGDVTWIVGSVLAAGGVVVLFTLAGDDSGGESSGSDSTSARLVPWAGPTGGGAVISGSF
jgi:hypothetical protein